MKNDLYLKHIINFEEDGIFSDSGAMKSTLAQVEEIFSIYIPNSGKKNLVIHIHGGLNNENTGLNILTKDGGIGQAYLNNDDIYPIHIVWESGFMDALKQIISNETAERLILEIGKIIGKSAFSWKNKRINEIYDISDLNDFELNLDLSNDFIEKNQNAEDYVISNISIISASKIFGKNQHKLIQQLKENYNIDNRQKGLRYAYIIVKAAVSIASRIYKRYKDPIQWNGFKNTLVEETIRELNLLETIGDEVWSVMKKNGNTTFNEGHDGENFLNILETFLLQNNDISLNIVSHSAGSFHANQMIKKISESSLKEKREKIFKSLIYLAPACSQSDFERIVMPYKDNIEIFRIFALKDSIEATSDMVPFFYNGSLLYMLSGLLEESVGYRNLGLERVINTSNNLYIKENTVISTTDDCIDGRCSYAKKHGSFDEDYNTQKSIVYLIQS